MIQTRTKIQMKTRLIHDPTEAGPVPGAVKASLAVLAELESVSILEAIRVRESTLTVFMEKILQSRPSSHWGINE
jgi:hypothetical protein